MSPVEKQVTLLSNPLAYFVLSQLDVPGDVAKSSEQRAISRMAQIELIANLLRLFIHAGPSPKVTIPLPPHGSRGVRQAGGQGGPCRTVLFEGRHRRDMATSWPQDPRSRRPLRRWAGVAVIAVPCVEKRIHTVSRHQFSPALRVHGVHLDCPGSGATMFGGSGQYLTRSTLHRGCTQAA